MTPHLVAFRLLMTKLGWARYGRLINGEVLTSTLGRSLYTCLHDQHTKHEGDIDPEDLKLYVRAVYGESNNRTDELIEYIDRIAATEVRSGTAEDAVREFYQRERCNAAAKYILETGGRGKERVDPRVAMGYLEAAVDVELDPLNRLTTFSTSSLPNEANTRDGVRPLGISAKLDSMRGGGIGNGEFMVLFAPPKRGKTSYLCTSGARAAARGENVLHITLEIPPRVVERRYDQVLTGLMEAELIEQPHVAMQARKNIRGEVYVLDWRDCETPTPGDIRETVRLMRTEGKTVDFIIIDYLYLMQPNDARRNRRIEMRHVWGTLGKELHVLAASLGMPILSAWQINRVGKGADTIESEHVSECWELLFHIDAGFALNQTKGELANRIMRLSVLEHRFTTFRGVQELYSDMDRCVVRDREEKETVEA